MPRKCKNVQCHVDTAIARVKSTSVPELSDNSYVLEMSSTTRYQDACRDRHLKQLSTFLFSFYFVWCVISLILVFYSILTYCETLNKIGKRLELLCQFDRPHDFHF